MCLAIPMKIVSIDRSRDLAQAEALGVTRTISVAMMGDDVKEGDWVMVHTGFALEKLECEEASEILSLLREVAEGE